MTTEHYKSEFQKLRQSVMRRFEAFGDSESVKKAKDWLREDQPRIETLFEHPVILDFVFEALKGVFKVPGEGETAKARHGVGGIYLGHRGRVGGGRKGIGKKAFMAWYGGEKEVVDDGGRYNEIIIIGALDDETLIEDLAAFTYSVSAFKEQAVFPS